MEKKGYKRIKVENINKSFGQVDVLKDVSLNILSAHWTTMVFYAKA